MIFGDHLNVGTRVILKRRSDWWPYRDQTGRIAERIAMMGSDVSRARLYRIVLDEPAPIPDSDQLIHVVTTADWMRVSPDWRDYSRDRGVDAEEMYVEVLFGLREGRLPDFRFDRDAIASAFEVPEELLG